MNDPCPHFTRLDVIRAKLHGDWDELEYILETDCEQHEYDLLDEQSYHDDAIGYYS
jgi:hypothetical protein